MLDYEHQVLIANLNAAYFLLNDRTHAPQNSSPFNMFSRLAKSHFDNEEDILASTSHHDAEIHRKEHQRLKNELDQILSSHGQGELAETINKPEKWLVSHILDLDMKIKIDKQELRLH